MLNGICALGIDSMPPASTGSTICRSRVSSVACPESLARIATSNARGSRPERLIRFQRHCAAAGQRTGQRRSAAALRQQRRLHRGAALGQREASVAQCRAVDTRKLHIRIHRKSVGPLPRIDAGGRFAAPILPLMPSRVSDWPSDLMAPLTGCNSTPPGNWPRSASNVTLPRQPDVNPTPSGRRRIVDPPAPIAATRTGASVIWSRPISPSTLS